MKVISQPSVGHYMQTRESVYINGRWVSARGDGSIEVINPATEQHIGSVPVGNVDDVNDAVAAAREAFPAWAQSSIEERQGYLNAISAALAERTFTAPPVTIAPAPATIVVPDPKIKFALVLDCDNSVLNRLHL